MEPTPPNLVISVVGGAKNFRLDGEMRDTFANGLIKVGLGMVSCEIWPSVLKWECKELVSRYVSVF